MSVIRRDEIVYEDGWRDAKDADAVDEPADEAVDESTDKQQHDKPAKAVPSKPLLTVLQLTVCTLSALVLFILNAMDSGAYHSFKQAYSDEMSKPVISQKFFDAVDWNALFGGSQTTVTATPDEIPLPED